MNDRLTQAQLQKLVAEVERLQNRQQDELAPEQVREILQELNLPPDLLPDAIVQLQRREALEVQQRRRTKIILGTIAGLLLLVGGGFFFTQQQQQALEQVVAQSDQIVLVPANQPVTTVNRPSELAYQVTLKQAPVGKTLSLRCDWLDPSGTVVKQNRYETKPITTEVWPTRCQHQLDLAAAPGTWTVKLFQGDRRLSDQTFEVR